MKLGSASPKWMVVALICCEKECVVVLIELYKKNVTVSYTTEPRVVVTILEYDGFILPSLQPHEPVLKRCGIINTLTIGSRE